MFDRLDPAPADSILGLTEAFKRDPNPRKVNLAVGVYKDAQGRTPVLAAVQEAERRLLEQGEDKSYLPIDGLPGLGPQVQALLFGAQHPVRQEGRAVTTQTPGGTGALRVAADFLARIAPEATVWLSRPTWPNHPHIFQAAGLRVDVYPYFDPTTHGVDFQALIDAVAQIPRGDVLVLHGCCHNPTGADLTPEQWTAVAQVAAERGILPLVDFAYQGFARGLEEDAQGIRILAAHCPEMMVASSFSKNFGLYNERTGALTLVAGTDRAAAAAQSHVKKVIRPNYSNPPAHGARVVHTVLGDPQLRARWEEEVREMRDRINATRHLLAESLHELGAPRDFSFIVRQRGMFSYTGLSPEQIQLLRERYAIYAVSSGRINVAGLTEDVVEYVAQAIVDVLTQEIPQDVPAS